MFKLKLDIVFENVDEVAVPGSVGTTGAFTFSDSGLESHLQQSKMVQYVLVLPSPFRVPWRTRYLASQTLMRV